jgi:hypothetical protein
MTLAALRKAAAAMPEDDSADLDIVAGQVVLPGVVDTVAVAPADDAVAGTPSGEVHVEPQAETTESDRTSLSVEVLPPEPLLEAPIAPVDADPQMVVSAETSEQLLAPPVSGNEPATEASRENPAEAVSAVDQALGDIPERDISAEAVAPATKTTLGADPVLAPAAAPVEGAAAAPATTEAPAVETEAASSEPAAESDAAASTEEPFLFGAKEAAELRVPADVVKMIAALPKNKQRDFVDGLRAERGAVSAAAKEESDRRRQRSPMGGGGGFSLFGGLASALGSAVRLAKGKTDPATLLSPDNIRARIEEVRRTEILEQADRVSRSHAAMTDATKAFNASLLSTDAGKAFEAKVGELADAHGMDRRKITKMSMEGTLASAIGSDPLKPLVEEAFKAEPVRKAWGDMERHADSLESQSKEMLDRMKVFEEHFPKSVDSEHLNKTVEGALEGIEKGFDEALAQSPEAKRDWKERLDALVKQVREFVERLLAKIGFAPR